MDVRRRQAFDSMAKGVLVGLVSGVVGAAVGFASGSPAWGLIASAVSGGLTAGALVLFRPSPTEIEAERRFREAERRLRESEASVGKVDRHIKQEQTRGAYSSSQLNHVTNRYR